VFGPMLRPTHSTEVRLQEVADARKSASGRSEAALPGETVRNKDAVRLSLPAALFDRLRNDFNLPFATAVSICNEITAGDDVIEQVGRSILSELAVQTPASRAYIETASLMLAARQLYKHCNGSTSTAAPVAKRGLDQNRLNRVLNYVAANIRDEITLANLASVAGYSPFHFARKFTSAMGMPPLRYISQMRLANARVELAAGTLAITEIALNAHFSSQASFTRAFHRVTGMTPREYQRRRR
jgi:AraC family transcriptional regulator